MKKVWRQIHPAVALLSIVGLFAVIAAGQSQRKQKKTPAKAAENAVVFVGAGDIASCRADDGDDKTAALLDKVPGTVFTAGDNAYPDGSIQQFRDCYGPNWGRHKARTRPAAGNHEYRTQGAAGYFEYFGAAAGDWGKGWYSFDLGAWHIIVLNSNCDHPGGCGPDSAQVRWLREDIAATPRACTAAIWHHPRFSSGTHGNNERVQTFWEMLYEAGVDLILNGHDHTYERFAPMNGKGERDDARGMREIVVGTGGAGLYPFLTVKPNSEVRDNKTWGVLKLTLRANSYDWEFVPVEGSTFTDRGTGACH